MHLSMQRYTMKSNAAAKLSTCSYNRSIPETMQMGLMNMGSTACRYLHCMQHRETIG